MVVERHSGYDVLGEIMIDGVSGVPGEVVISQGPGFPPVWGVAGGGSSKMVNYVVAAVDSDPGLKAIADYVCDGVDDHLTVQDAYNALGGNPGTIGLCSGTYTWGTGTVTLNSSYTEIIGMGWGTVIQGATNTNYFTVTSATADIFGIRIAHLKIDGTLQTIGSGIYVLGQGNYDVKYSVFENCFITDCDDYGIYLFTTSSGSTVRYIYIRNNIICNTVVGIHMDGTAGNTERQMIANNILYGNVTGIELDGASSHTTIIGNKFEVNTSYGIFIPGIANHVSITGNNFAANNGGVKLQTSQAVSITGNVFADTVYNFAGYHPIYLYGPPQSVTITGNSFKSCARSAIYDNGYGFNTISENIFFDCCSAVNNTYDVITLEDSKGNNISGNHVYGIQANRPRYFVGELGTAGRNCVTNNRVVSTSAGLPVLSVVTGVVNFISPTSYGQTSAEDNITNHKTMVTMTNTSGGNLLAGNVVVLKAVANGKEVTTTVNQGDDMVFGVLAENINNTESGFVQTSGKTTLLKVNGVAAIAIGDLLGTHTDAGIAMKASAGDMAFAIALEAYAGADSLGVIDALLITPRKL